MKLEVGQFVRFEGMINKIIDIEDDNYLIFDCNWFDHWGDEVSVMRKDRFINDYIPITSFNIIDLIEVGDYVNGKCVIKIYEKGTKFTGSSDYIFNEKTIEVENDNYETIPTDCLFTNDKIETIVTNKMFKQMSYFI